MFSVLLVPAVLIGLLAAGGLAIIEIAKVALIMYAFKDQDRKDLLLALISRSRKW